MYKSSRTGEVNTEGIAQSANDLLLSNFIRLCMTWKGAPIISITPNVSNWSYIVSFSPERIPSFQWQTKVFSSLSSAISVATVLAWIRVMRVTSYWQQDLDWAFYIRLALLREIGIHLFSDIQKTKDHFFTSCRAWAYKEMVYNSFEKGNGVRYKSSLSCSLCLKERSTMICQEGR